VISYLPPLDEGQLTGQIKYLLDQNLIPAIEYTAEPDARDHYWSMWKLPLFDARLVPDVITEIDACVAAHPDCYIKVIGYDRRRQTQAVSLVAHRP